MFKHVSAPGITSEIKGLYSLGITPELKQRLVDVASLLSQKQLITFSKIVPNPVFPELADVTLDFQVLGETVSDVTVTIVVPDIASQFSDSFVSKIDDVERSGMAWAEERSLYKGRELEILQNTFCSALVHTAYPVELGDSSVVDKMKFSTEESVLLDKWIRALFANDEERDVFSLVECPEAVELDNRKMMSRLSSGTLSKLQMSPSPKLKKAEGSFDEALLESKKIQAMHEVVSELNTLAGSVPSYFFITLHNYFESTVLEAGSQFELRWPSHTQLETAKEDSSGSVHAIAAGAAVKGLWMDQLLENLTLKYIGRYSAKAVESHNDINSHSKETRQRIKKLLTVLNELDERYNDFQPFIESGKQSEDPNLNYLMRVYTAIQEINQGLDLSSVSEKVLFLKYLEILPSFNRVDLYLRSGKSLEESYGLVAERGNESILEMTRSIKSHLAALQNGSVVVPKSFKKDLPEFNRQSRIWLSICEGWGSQNIWEWEARRYNEGLVAMGGRQFVDRLLSLKESLSITGDAK